MTTIEIAKANLAPGALERRAADGGKNLPYMRMSTPFV